MRICTLASGSSGNSTLVEGEDGSILVDAGLSGRAVVGGLNSIGIEPSDLDGILVTHEHVDHIRGVGVLARKFDLRVYASEGAWGKIGPSIGKIPAYNQCVLERGKALCIEDLQIEHFETSHDAADSIGFAIHSEGAKVGILTDTGYLTDSARKHIDGSDLFVFEANHDLHMLKTGRYPWNLKKRILSDRGHLSNVAAGHCLASLVSGKTKGVILAHLSEENNSPGVAYSTVAGILEEAGLAVNRNLVLDVAPRCEAGAVWDI